MGIQLQKDTSYYFMFILMKFQYAGTFIQFLTRKIGLPIISFFAAHALQFT